MTPQCLKFQTRCIFVFKLFQLLRKINDSCLFYRSDRQTGAIKKLHNSLMFFLLIFIRKFLILLDSFITRWFWSEKKLLSKAMCTVTWVSLIRPSIKCCLFKRVQVTVPCMLSKLKVLLYKIPKTIVTLPLWYKPLLQDYNSCLLIKTLALFDISGSI